MPTWKPPESADSLPNRIRSNGPPAASSAADGVDDRRRGRDRIPVAAVGLEQDRRSIPMAIASRSWSAASAGPRVMTTDVAAVRLDEPDGLLDRALLVRADDEAEESRCRCRGRRRSG